MTHFKWRRKAFLIICFPKTLIRSVNEITKRRKVFDFWVWVLPPTIFTNRWVAGIVYHHYNFPRSSPLKLCFVYLYVIFVFHLGLGELVLWFSYFFIYYIVHLTWTQVCDNFSWLLFYMFQSLLSLIFYFSWLRR